MTILKTHFLLRKALKIHGKIFALCEKITLSYSIFLFHIRFLKYFYVLVKIWVYFNVDATLKTIRDFCCKFQSFLQNGFIKNEVRVYNCHYKDTNNYFNTPSQR